MEKRSFLKKIPSKGVKITRKAYKQANREKEAKLVEAQQFFLRFV